jgi:hypothetical protein
MVWSFCDTEASPKEHPPMSFIGLLAPIDRTFQESPPCIINGYRFGDMDGLTSKVNLGNAAADLNPALRQDCFGGQ